MTDFAPRSLLPRSLLYVPGSNARALDKARGLAADLLIIDLEDAVPVDRKAEARAAMRAAIAAGFPGKRVAVRINGTGSEHQADDLAAVAGLALDAVVLPKVDAPSDLDPARALGAPLLPMIETPAAIYAARDIAADPATHGLIAGLNDLAHELKLPDGMDRGAMSHAIQAIVLAARAGGVWCFDGVYNAIDDAAGHGLEIRPVASMQALVGQQAEAPVVLGVDGQQALEDGNGFFGALELGEDDAAVAKRRFVFWLDGQHPLKALQRFDVAMLFT